MEIGAIIFNLIWFGYGIFLIILSVWNKENLGDKTILGKLFGTIFVLLAFINLLIGIIGK